MCSSHPRFLPIICLRPHPAPPPRPGHFISCPTTRHLVSSCLSRTTTPRCYTNTQTQQRRPHSPLRLLPSRRKTLHTCTSVLLESMKTFFLLQARESLGMDGRQRKTCPVDAHRLLTVTPGQSASFRDPAVFMIPHMEVPEPGKQLSSCR